MSAPAIAVVGAGYMGALHAGKLAQLSGEGAAVFAGVCDANPERAQLHGDVAGQTLVPDGVEGVAVLRRDCAGLVQVAGLLSEEVDRRGGAFPVQGTHGADGVRRVSDLSRPCLEAGNVA